MIILVLEYSDFLFQNTPIIFDLRSFIKICFLCVWCVCSRMCVRAWFEGRCTCECRYPRSPEEDIEADWLALQEVVICTGN